MRSIFIIEGYGESIPLCNNSSKVMLLLLLLINEDEFPFFL